jgi:hypothetical protein
MQFFVSLSDGTIGPFSTKKLHNLIDRGRIKPTDLCWEAGDFKNKKPVGVVLDLDIASEVEKDASKKKGNEKSRNSKTNYHSSTVMAFFLNLKKSYMLVGWAALLIGTISFAAFEIVKRPISVVENENVSKNIGIKEKTKESLNRDYARRFLKHLDGYPDEWPKVVEEYVGKIAEDQDVFEKYYGIGKQLAQTYLKQANKVIENSQYVEYNMVAIIKEINRLGDQEFDNTKKSFDNSEEYRAYLIGLERKGDFDERKLGARIGPGFKWAIRYMSYCDEIRNSEILKPYSKKFRGLDRYD